MGVPTDSDLVPFADDGAFAKFELVSGGPPGDGNSPPVAEPGGAYSAGVGEAVKFDGSDSYDPDGKIDSYEWDFGEGSKYRPATPPQAILDSPRIAQQGFHSCTASRKPFGTITYSRD